MRSLLTGKLLQRAEDMLHLLSHSLKDAETPEAQSTGSQVAAFSETATALAFFFCHHANDYACTRPRHAQLQTEQDNWKPGGSKQKGQQRGMT